MDSLLTWSITAQAWRREEGQSILPAMKLYSFVVMYTIYLLDCMLSHGKKTHWHHFPSNVFRQHSQIARTLFDDEGGMDGNSGRCYSWARSCSWLIVRQGPQRDMFGRWGVMHNVLEVDDGESQVRLFNAVYNQSNWRFDTLCYQLARAHTQNAKPILALHSFPG